MKVKRLSRRGIEKKTVTFHHLKVVEIQYYLCLLLFRNERVIERAGRSSRSEGFANFCCGRIGKLQQWFHGCCNENYDGYFKANFRFATCVSETMINGQEIPKMVLVRVINRHTMALRAWSLMGSLNPTGML